jgi:hypothetical protein
MFEPRSRYSGIPVATHTITGADGQPREIRYVRRRFIPDLSQQPTMIEHRVAQGDRLDLIAARYLGDPTAFWRVADANVVLDPDELTAEAGRLIRIALPDVTR